ncbi:MAG: ATP-binding protein [Mollicutes bacterium]|nr:ATP-binding protein [Mollicutes bacterium]
MANAVIILGSSGTGKSTSVKNLDPKTTVVFNTLKKRLPFKGSNSIYNTNNKNLYELNDYKDVIKYLQNISDKGTHIKNVIIDDAIFIMRKEYFDRAKENGYGKFTDMALHFQNIIETCENLRSDLNVFFMLHSEPVISDNTIVGYKVATVGKMLDQQYNPVEVVPMVLFSSVQFKDGKPQYGFYTHSVIDKGAIIPAKSPDGMFNDDFIPNDLEQVVKAMDEYYG